jgi:hypothetical protein
MTGQPLGLPLPLLFVFSMASPSGVEVSGLAQAGVIRFADDDVIEDFDFQRLTGADEVASYFDVGFARRGFSARVVVHQDNCRGASDNGQTEYADRVD